LRTTLTLVVGGCLAVSCRQPTQLTVEISTNVACQHVGGTNIIVGQLPGDLEKNPASTSTRACSGGGGNETIGSIVLLPSGAEDGAIAFKIVLGIDKSADDCAPSYANCIVARRSLLYLPHEATTVHVDLDLDCAGVPCGESMTCQQGACMPAACADSNCTSLLDAGVSTEGGGATGADAPDGTDAASPDATSSVPAGVDATVTMQDAETGDTGAPPSDATSKVPDASDAGDANAPGQDAGPQDGGTPTVITGSSGGFDYSLHCTSASESPCPAGQLCCPSNEVCCLTNASTYSVQSTCSANCSGISLCEHGGQSIRCEVGESRVDFSMISACQSGTSGVCQTH
jgi:hypothetical protein